MQVRGGDARDAARLPEGIGTDATELLARGLDLLLQLRLPERGHGQRRPDRTGQQRAGEEDAEAGVSPDLAVEADVVPDLAAELTKLIADMAGGRVIPKVYRQFKMYNDPKLNPAVYGEAKR